MWDLTNHHCFATLTGHSGPVWDFAVSPDCQLLVSGAADAQLRVWRLSHSTHDECEVPTAPVAMQSENPDSLIVPLTQHRSLVCAEFLGSVQRNGSRRVHTLCFDGTGTFLISQSFERNLEIFRLLDQGAQAKRLRKKAKKAKGKGSPPEEVKLEINDILRPILRITLPAKVSSCATLSARPWWKNGVVCEQRLRRAQSNWVSWCMSSDSMELEILQGWFLCALKNNAVEELEANLPATGSSKVQTVQISRGSAKSSCVRLLNEISAPGHRTVPIACALTSDGLGVFTLARTEAKLWSR
ncbi:unnamed protein product [Echinostoma caproni]|uniref:WD_REPEATS_REGION domain-containing protein n=1 Tax=Echinostoma caproni TaxID=27848 RepID=A0A183ATR1_9TREM|nr:unnamed protein product [Echinostoma caproni]